MTGATIDEKRTDSLRQGHVLFDRGSAALSGGVSVENDYLADQRRRSTARRTSTRRTPRSRAGSASRSTSISRWTRSEFPVRPDEENKQSDSVFVGVSQVLGRAPRCRARSVPARRRLPLGSLQEGASWSATAIDRRAARHAPPVLVADALPPAHRLLPRHAPRRLPASTGTTGASMRTRSRSPGTRCCGRASG